MNAYDLDRLKKTDLVVADPPRAGLGAQLSKIICGSTEKVVYIACEPPNLVRDLRIFSAKGFRVERLYIIDLFPDTPHFEIFAVITKDRA